MYRFLKSVGKIDSYFILLSFRLQHGFARSDELDTGTSLLASTEKNQRLKDPI
jgi:hypothetical protein